MSTTTLFVELVVIGVGAFVWLGLLVMALLGVAWWEVEALADKAALAIPALTVVYLLGIVVDRMADQLFHFGIARRMRQGYGLTDAAESAAERRYYENRADLLKATDKFADLYEYSRSRQRICRGWTLNSIMLVLALIVQGVWGSDRMEPRTVVTLSAAFCTLAYGSFWAWKILVKTELARIAEHSNALRRTTNAAS